MKWHRRYGLIFLISLLLPLPLLWINWLFLEGHGEWKPLEHIVQEQLTSEHTILYGTAIHDDEFHYKMTLAEKARPEIVVIGSSRAMMFEKQYFKSKFINMGRAMSSVQSGFPIAQHLLSLAHPPKVVIFSVDFWWFNARHRLPQPPKGFPPQEPRLTLSKLLTPLTWLYQKKIHGREWLLMDRQPLETSAHVGVRAIRQGNGFRPDGSGLYTALAVGEIPASDSQFSQTIKDISLRKHGFFQTSSEPDPIYLQQFAALVQKLETAGVQTIVALAPLPPRVLAELAKHGDKYGYLARLAPEMAARNIRVHDYLTGKTLAGDCEYLDGFHGGSVIYARLMRDLLQQESAILSPHVNATVLDSLIEKFAGRTQWDEEFLKGRPEIDFLKLGCVKPNVPQGAQNANSKISL
ncbi:MAG: hypothetical protein G8345_08320 [Magnetococcales bacterium]|nr:hypothetical protein [Magnetococcales bacterium]